MQGIPLFSTVNLLINHEQPDDYRDEMPTTAIDQTTSHQQSNNIEPDNDENLIDSDLNSENSEPEIDDEQAAEDDSPAANSNVKKQQQQRRKLLNTSKLDTCTVQVYPALNPGKLKFNLKIF